MADDVVGWVSGPTERGTLTLVWSCVITIFACTWTVLHLNVPGRHDDSFIVALRKLKWMVINILFPEFVLSKAVCDLRLALQELIEFGELLRYHKKTIEWTTRQDDDSYTVKWTWEIEYPDGWSGLLYDLLGLDRPTHLRHSALTHFLSRFKIGLPSVSTHPGHITLEPQARQRSSVDPNVGSREAEDSLSPHRTMSQKWTVVHSYYAQMGGFIFPHVVYDAFSTITASHLTRWLIWHKKENKNHPFMHLILGRADIQDKSKADWLLKSLSILQGAWIIINVIVRHVTKLPISQIEITTVAFAIMAVLTYLANWWKPKDVSQPTMLQYFGRGKSFNLIRDSKQSFIQRILFPTKAIRRGGPDFVERVANDVVWLQGDIPLLFYLMAGSSFIFGALHCLAWNFEFPTTVELICWRVASLVSAILPVVALAISTILGHLAVFNFSQRHIEPQLSAELEMVLPAEPRQLLMVPRFRDWHKDSQYAFVQMPKRSRNWEVEPTSVETEQWGTPNNGKDDHPLFQLSMMVETLDWYIHRTSVSSWNSIAEITGECKELLEVPEVLELWREYEGSLKSQNHDLRTPVVSSPVTTYLEQILKVTEKVSNQKIIVNKRAEQASKLVFITSLVLYTAARLVILVLLFTSLRAGPAGVYQDTTWTRFLPKFS